MERGRKSDTEIDRENERHMSERKNNKQRENSHLSKVLGTRLH